MATTGRSAIKATIRPVRAKKPKTGVKKVHSIRIKKPKV